MANKEAADRALKEPNPIIDGRKANVNLAILGAKPRGNITGWYNLLDIKFKFNAWNLFEWFPPKVGNC